MSGYTKLFGSILASTVWDLPATTKVVWITILAMADRHGEVQASVPGLAKFAGVTREECDRALEAFLSPDPDSRTKESEGRRLEVIDGGWRLINHLKYSQQLSADDRRERDAERQRRHRDKRDMSRDITGDHASHYTQTEIQTQTQTDPDRIPPAKRVKSTEPKEPNQFDQAVTDFSRVWESRYHRPYLATATDKNQLGRHWRGAPEWQRAQWPQICRAYLAKSDEFFIKQTTSHSLHWLVLKGLNQFTGPAPPSKEQLAAAELRKHERRRATERSASADDLGGMVGQLALSKTLPPEEDEEAGRARAIAQLRARGIT